MDAFRRDLALAVRMLRRRPAFTALAVTVLALAIGANSAIFSVVEGVLLRAPGFEDPGRLVFVWEARPARNQIRNVVASYNYAHWRERVRSFTGMAAFTPSGVNLTGGGDPERLDAARATGNLFAVLGVRPFLGRALSDEDSRAQAAPVVVLSEGFWRRRFAADPGIVGRSLVLDGRPTTVVGVMPQSFQLPAGKAAWLPITLDQEMHDSWRGRSLMVVARLAPQTTLAQARDEMARLHEDLAREQPAYNTGWTTNVFSLPADLVRDVRPALAVLMGAVSLLLLVACANVANLLLARALSREREVAIRSALGASPARLVRQLLAESLLLGGLGGVAGLLLGAWLLQGLLALLPAEVRLVAHVGLNPAVLAFTAAVSLASAILFGLAPALQQARPSLVPALKEGGQTRGASHARRRLKGALVVSEIALALVLTAGTGLLLRSFWRLANVDPGFRPHGVLTVPVGLPDRTYPTAERQAAFIREAVAHVSRVPGVQSAAAMSATPLGGGGSATRFRVLDRPVPPRGEEPSTNVRIVTPGLFRTLAIPLLAGRDFDQRDVAGRPAVVVVSRGLAREFWADKNPLGQRVSLSWDGWTEAEVVGVVGDVRFNALDRDMPRVMYWPQAQLGSGFMTLLVRTSGPPPSLVPAVRQELAALDRDLPPGRFRTLDEVAAGSLDQPRFLLRLLAAFALVALALAAVGVYGVMSYTVGERIPEVGVRLAIGASPGDIVRLILREGLALAAAGIAIGLALAAAGAGALGTLLYEVPPRDPVSLAAVAALLLVATLAAAWLPARRAARTDPLKALRAE
ncbi:MAG TPA: ABC transporter permease [Vicinamibacteria bacterium]|nr:ABC transporter permease [Vicinamibacteria bacterium]